ncbi:hypothetical protein F5Y19DRAFT_468980 [Xylariaceae sp. FL1651]|nr:hypothetical protein F5Y19DRAFT_468980 [Xylariaceae sp. FL1651]
MYYARNNTIDDFNEDEAYNKILKFIIDNNISFNILDSDSFKDLLNYYNRLTPVINRKKIKVLLDKTYENAISNFNILLKNHDITFKLRKLITSIKYTQENRKLFKEGIEKYKREGFILLNYNKTIIPLDNKTRWNSTYYMIEASLTLKEALLYTAKNTNNIEYKNSILSNFENNIFPI